jgi:hypothetical protein
MSWASQLYRFQAICLTAERYCFNICMLGGSGHTRQEPLKAGCNTVLTRQRGDLAQ